jgi:hypothetical protein
MTTVAPTYIGEFAAAWLILSALYFVVGQRKRLLRDVHSTHDTSAYHSHVPRRSGNTLRRQTPARHPI